MKIKTKKLEKSLLFIGFILAIIYIFSITEANASTTSKTTLDLNLASYHFKSKGLNQINLGLGLTKHINHHWFSSIGFYEGSYEDIITYGFIGVKHDMKNWRFGIQAGLLYGYEGASYTQNNTSCIITITSKHNSKYDNNSNNKKSNKKCETTKQTINMDYDKFEFVILPSISYVYNKNHAVKFLVIPPVSSKNEVVITAQYQYGGFDFL